MTDPILIADLDLEYLGAIRLEPQFQKTPPVIATNENDSTRLLEKTGASYSAIVLNPELEKKSSQSVIRLALKHFPAVPLFFLTGNKNNPFSPEDLSCLTVRKVLVKPISLVEILQVVQRNSTSFNPDAVIRQASENTDLLDQASTSDSNSFVPILARQFLSGSVSLFDLYVKLGNEKFLKILQAGDAFDGNRVNDYLKKGVTYFYLRKEAQETYLKYWDQLSATALEKAGLTAKMKTNLVLNYGEEATKFLASAGIEEASLSYARTYVDRTRDLADRLVEQGGEQLKSLLADAVAYEHGVAVTMIGALLAEQMKLQADKSIQTVGFSCLFHDIGLQKMDEKFRLEDEANLTQQDRELFQTHPDEGRKILQLVKGIDSIVLQAVLQHHERRDRLGFPLRIGAGGINRIAEIVGICDEFLRLLKFQKSDVRDEMERKIFPRFSTAVVDAFNKRFFAP